jgi:NAD(P)H-dependent FMN reductase
MLETKMTDDAGVLVSAVLDRRPVMSRRLLAAKLDRVLTLLLKEYGAGVADLATVKEAMKLVIPRSLETTFIRLEDPARYKRIIRDGMDNLEAYYAMPRLIKRWPPVPLKPVKPSSETKILAFCASPRRKGNTEVMVDEAIAGARSAGASVVKIRIDDLKLKFCKGCRKCKDAEFKDYCTINDDMTELYPRIASADAIIIGFPVYTESHCGQLAAFFDRWDPFLWKKFGTKRAMVIGGWGFPEISTYDHLIEHVMFILKIHQVETVEAISACGLIGKLRGLDENGRAILLKYPGELEKVRNAGRALVLGSGITAG